jgi:putative (di)nucleoside polyphosphate hydrolase
MATADPRPYRLGVGIMLIARDGRVFVADRIDMDGPAWQMPQGGIDAHEDPRAAALRELQEETGIEQVEILGETAGWLTYDLPPALAAKAWGGRYRGQQQKWYAARFLGSDADIDLAAHGKAEFSAWRWIDVESLLGLIVPFKRKLYGAVVAELGKYCVPA